jgi:hypothetical protein
MPQDILPPWGEHHALRPALEQRAAELRLALLHLLADRARRDADLIGGRAQASETPHGLDRAQPAKADPGSDSSYSYAIP